MRVEDLIEQLQRYPKDTQVEINDNRNGEIHIIDSVDYFPWDQDYPVVIIQVNV